MCVWRHMSYAQPKNAMVIGEEPMTSSDSVTSLCNMHIILEAWKCSRSPEAFDQPLPSLSSLLPGLEAP